jgi:hypothetical protein
MSPFPGRCGVRSVTLEPCPPACPEVGVATALHSDLRFLRRPGRLPNRIG